MKDFKQLNVRPMAKGLSGLKMKVVQVLNVEITVKAFELLDSKYEKSHEKCLKLQFVLKGNEYILFSGSASLIHALQQIDKDNFPFTATIIKDENGRLEFT